MTESPVLQIRRTPELDDLLQRAAKLVNRNPNDPGWEKYTILGVLREYVPEKEEERKQE